MRAAPRRSCLGLGLCFALALPAAAIERDVPATGLSGAQIVPAPGAKTAPTTLNTKTTLPLAPNAGVETSLPSTNVEAPAPVVTNGVEPLAPQVANDAEAPEIESPVPAVAPGTEKILQQLSPGNAGDVSDDQASALAAKLIDPSMKVRGAAEPLYLSQITPSASGRLAPWQQDHLENVQTIAHVKPEQPEPRPTAREWIHYKRLWVENLWFYLVTNIRNKWGPYLGYWEKLRDSGVPTAVMKPRAFFAGMRVFGQTGYFYMPGFWPMDDPGVIKEAREKFAQYFDGPAITDKERAAFEGFLQRALVFNVKRRAGSKFRAMVRDNMLKASTMTPDKIAPFFDGLPGIAKTDEFQNKAADAMLARFKEEILAAIKEEPQGASDRITGVILIGSFALGAATPKSDFDLEPLTADGTSGRVQGFVTKFKKRWEDDGFHQTNPVSFHMFGYLDSRWEVRQIHHEPYIVISSDPNVVANLAMRPGEPPSYNPTRQRTPLGDVLRGLQYAAVIASSLTTTAK